MSRALSQLETESLHAAIEYVGQAWEPEDRHDLDRLDGEVVKALPLDHVLVVAVWRVQEQECYNCGLPAVFTIGETPPRPHEARCAICAANDAADGEQISRFID